MRRGYLLIHAFGLQGLAGNTWLLTRTWGILTAVFNIVSMAVPQYSYKPLRGSREIRLLYLHPPQNGSNELRCDIHHCRDLESSPDEYEALSYTWADENGDKTLRKSIRCNGTTMHVTMNLAMALRELRHPNCPRILWVDAVCINQNNDDEKNVQVGMMGYIYRRARQVVAWVGPESAMDVAAFRVVNYLHAEGWFSPEELYTWFSLVRFIKRTWFSRVWIVQELALAKKIIIYCGKNQLDWDILRRGLVKFLDRMGVFLNTSKADVSLERMFTLLSIRNLVTDHSDEQPQRLGRFTQFSISQIDDGRASKQVERGDLLRFMASTRLFGATEPKDRIYAMLGLVLDNDRDGIEIIYSKNVSYGDVYREFVRVLILQHGTLDVLSQAGLHSALPSWVPDWTLPMKCYPLALHKYYASGAVTKPALSWASNERNSRLRNQDRVLKLRGILCDTIRTLTPGIMSDTVESSVFEREALNAAKGSVFVVALATGKGLREMLQFTLDSDSLKPVRIYKDEANSWMEAAHISCRELYGDAHWEERWGAVEGSAFIKTLIGNLPFEPLGSDHEALFAHCYAIWREWLSRNPLLIRTGIFSDSSSIPVQPELIKLFSRHGTSWLSEERSMSARRGMVQINSSTKVPIFVNEKLARHYFNTKRCIRNILGSDDADSSRAPAEEDARRSHLMHDDASVKMAVARMFSRAVERMARNRQFCTTSSRRFIGWVPSEAQIGDVVCLLEGGRVPYILRPLQGGLYSFIGDAYVHGLMRGEGWSPNSLQMISLT